MALDPVNERWMRRKSSNLIRLGMSQDLQDAELDKKAREAMKQLFDDKGHPLTEEEITREIVEIGGFRTDDGRIDFARLVVERSIRQHLPGGDEHKTWPLKKRNGFIAPEERRWPDEMFKVQN